MKEIIEKKTNDENYYEEIFKRVEQTPTIGEENKDWEIEELNEILLKSFTEAGEIAMKENDGKIYLGLSGGLDSTLALAILRKQYPDQEIITFTLGGNEKHRDIQYARLAAKAFKSNHVEIIPNADEIHDVLMDYKKEFPEKDLKEATRSGDIDTYLLLKKMSGQGVKNFLTFDGIDEQMGGYWAHKRNYTEDDKQVTPEDRKETFNYYWQRLIQDHLDPLIKKSKNFKIDIQFPYLNKNLVEFISHIPINDRVKNKTGKLPLRELAKIYGVPEEIINRKKRGRNGMLEINHTEEM